MTADVPTTPGPESSAHPPSRGIGWPTCLIIFLVALLLRVGAGYAFHAPSTDDVVLEFPDERQYWSMSRALRAGQGLPDELGFQATRMPLFPAVLALFPDGLAGVLAARALQCVIAASAAVLAACLAGVWFDRGIAMVAGLLVACDPFLVYSSSLLLTEPIYLALAVALWCALAVWLHDGSASIKRWAFVGLIAAACVYARESSLGLVLAALVFVAVCHPVRRSALAGAGVIVIIVAVLLTPWAARNKRVAGSWIWLTTRAGISLYDGVRPGATGASDLGEIKQMPAVHGKTETQWNRFFLRASRRAMMDDPLRLLRLAAVKIARTWSPAPHVSTQQRPGTLAVGVAWSIPTYAFAVAGAVYLWKRRERNDRMAVAFFFLPAVYLTALHAVFVGSIRYRLGAVPMLYVLAAVALLALGDRRKQRLGPCDRSRS